MSHTASESQPPGPQGQPVAKESDRKSEGRRQGTTPRSRRTPDGDAVRGQSRDKVTNAAARATVCEALEDRVETIRRTSAEHGGRVHMDLVDLYLPECFTYHSDTE